MTGRDVVAVVLAIGAAGAVIVVAIGAAVSGRGVSSSEGALLGTIVGASVGAIATYLGGYRSAPLPPPQSPPYDGVAEGDWPTQELPRQ